MVEIVDHTGEPIKQEQLREPQTAKVGSLPSFFSDHPSRGLTPAKLASILEDAERGNLVGQAELGEDMEEKDAHIFAELDKRKRAILGPPWDIVPPPNATAAEDRAAKAIAESIRDMFDIEDVILDLADAIGKGYACLEHEWARQGREWWIEKAHYRPPSWFTVARDDPDTLRLRDGSPQGQALTPFGWSVHVHKAKSGYLGRSALHRVLAWPYLFKVYSVRDLAEFLEIYGLPLRLGTYPAGASDQEKARLLQAVVSIGHNAAGIIPAGMAMEFKEAAKGSNDPFDAMIGWCERSQSKAILGGTLTSQTDQGSGAYALGNVHNEVRADIMRADAKQIATTLSRDICYPLAALNHGITDSRRAPRFRFDIREPQDLKLYSEALPKLVEVGVQIPKRWAHERLQIPEPEKGEDVLQINQAAPVPVAANRGRAVLAGQVEPPDTVDIVTARLAPLADGAISEWVDQVADLVDRADSLEALRDGLDEIFPELPAGKFAVLMQEAMSVVAMAGRAEILDGQ